jgi:O-antigen ligase
MALVGAIVTPAAWWLVPPIVAGIAASGCRGAMVGVACAGLLWLWTYSRPIASAFLTAALLVVVVMILYPSQRATMGEEGRLGMWQDAIENLRWLGHGIGAYWVVTPQHAPHGIATNMRYWHVHNDYLEAVFNYGVGSVLYFAFVASCLLARPLRTEHYVLVAFMGIGLFAFPLYNPATGFVALVVAGRLAACWPPLWRRLDGGADRDLMGDADPGTKRIASGILGEGRKHFSPGPIFAGPAGAGGDPVPRPVAEAADSGGIG